MGFWERAKEQFLEDSGVSKVLKLDYIGGIPGVKPKQVKIKKGGQLGMIKIDSTEYQVTTIEWEEKHTRSAGKAAAGAIVGGLLTGGIGAIAGAAIGGRKKDQSTAVIETAEGYTILVRCNPKEFAELLAMRQ